MIVKTAPVTTSDGSLHCFCSLKCSHEESLATISKLCKLSVLVESEKNAAKHAKSQFACTIVADDLFSNLSVLRRSKTNIDQEIQVVLDFIKNMAILYHSVAWTICVAEGPLSTPSTLLSIPPRPSVVAERFASVLKSVSETWGEVRVRGAVQLLSSPSPPGSNVCPYHHLYINSRWWKHCEEVDTVISTATPTPPPEASRLTTARHAPLSRPSRPRFVLQVMCPEAMLHYSYHADGSFHVDTEGPGSALFRALSASLVSIFGDDDVKKGMHNFKPSAPFSTVALDADFNKGADGLGSSSSVWAAGLVVGVARPEDLLFPKSIDQSAAEPAPTGGHTELQERSGWTGSRSLSRATPPATPGGRESDHLFNESFLPAMSTQSGRECQEDDSVMNKHDQAGVECVDRRGLSRRSVSVSRVTENVFEAMVEDKVFLELSRPSSQQQQSLRHVHCDYDPYADDGDGCEDPLFGPAALARQRPSASDLDDITFPDYRSQSPLVPFSCSPSYSLSSGGGQERYLCSDDTRSVEEEEGIVEPGGVPDTDDPFTALVSRSSASPEVYLEATAPLPVMHALDDDFWCPSATPVNDGEQLSKEEIYGIRSDAPPPTTQLTPVCLTKEEIQHLSCLGQVEDKYILARADGVLVVVDQHAAHERIQLERMTRRLHHVERGRDGRRAEMVTVSLRVELYMSSRAVEALQDAKMSTLVRSWGFAYSTGARSTAVDEKANSYLNHHRHHRVLLTRVPMVEGEPLTAGDFVEFVNKLTETEAFMLPAAALEPPAVFRILASKSCRTAIKFGDSLTTPECESILQDLAQCDMPFQCAHGRPSVVPLTLLRSLEDTTPSSSRAQDSYYQTKPHYKRLMIPTRNIQKTK